MPVGKPLHLRLFLEGEEVPVIAAQVSGGLNAPASASIQVIPLDEGEDLKPRTMVHLFFLDNFDVRVATTDAGNRKEEDRLNIPFLDNYKLLFSGEVVGFQSAQTPNSRGLVLQCLDLSSYWDQAHATAIEYGPNGNAFTHGGALRASNTGLFDDIVNTTSDMLVRWINQKPLTEGLKNVSGLAGGVIRMLEMMGGVPRHHRGVNDFFTVAQLRCRVLEQISAEENDSTAAGLLKVSVFDEWLRNGLQNAGQQITFRDMLKLLFGYIHYEVVPNPAAKFDDTVQGSSKPNIVSEELFKHPQAKKAIEDLLGIQTSLLRYTSTRDLPTLRAIVTNYTGQLRRVDENLALLQSSKKTLSQDVAKIRSNIAKAVNGLAAQKNPENGAFVVDVSASIEAAINGIKTSKAKVSAQVGVITTGATQRLRSQIIRPDCFFAPPPRCNVIFPEQFTQLTYDRSFLSEATRSLVLGYNTLVGRDALLADRILAPSVGVDTELLAVKTGKEGYRALMKHELHTGIIPRSEWLPNISSFSSSKTTPDKKNDVKDQRVSWARNIALFHFFKYRFGPRQAGVGGRFNPYVVCGFPALIIQKPFIVPGVSQGSEATDAQVIEGILSQSKTSSNTAKAPSQLLGMVVALSHSLDQNGGSTSISMTHVRKHLGIDDEFLGVFLQAKGTAKRRVRVRLKASEIAKSDKESLKSVLLRVTPQSAASPKSKSTTKKTVTKTVQSSRVGYDSFGKRMLTDVISDFEVINESPTAAPPLAPSLTEFGKIDKIERQVLVPSPPGKLTVNGNGVFGKIIGIEVIDPTVTTLSTKAATVTPSALSSSDQQKLKQATAQKKVTNKATSPINGQVYSEVILYEEVEVPIQSSTPIEEIIRSRWFSESYSNAQIGSKIYQPFFGVPSIIDEAIFSGLGETTSSNPAPAVSDGLTASPEEDLTKLKDSLSKEENAKARLSIERAVNFIGYQYGLVRSRGADVEDFIRQYASRPIATLPQILGDPDLDFTLDAQGKATVVQTTGVDGTTRTPRIGFHSMAIHPKVVDAGNLAGLLEEPDLHVQRINNTGAAGPIPPEYDVRKEKKDRVRRYINALSLGPGFRG